MAADLSSFHPSGTASCQVYTLDSPGVFLASTVRDSSALVAQAVVGGEQLRAAQRSLKVCGSSHEKRVERDGEGWWCAC